MTELVVWITCWTGRTSLDELATAARALRTRTRASPTLRLLLPVHYGPWVESDCRRTLPADLVVSSPDDVAAVRARVEALGFRFGAWGVPHRADGGGLAGRLARAAGYYVGNFEIGEFWEPGQKDPVPVRDYWTAFWTEAGDALSGQTFATLVPSDAELGAYRYGEWAVLREISAGCSGLVLETYGGPHVADYRWPNLWPMASLERVRVELGAFTPRLLLMPADDNLAEQWKFAAWAGNNVVHTWCI